LRKGEERLFSFLSLFLKKKKRKEKSGKFLPLLLSCFLCAFLKRRGNGEE